MEVPGDPDQANRRGKGHPTGKNDRAAAAGVAEQSEHGLHQVGEEIGHCQQDPDLEIGQSEVVTDEWPGSLARAEDELVQELNGQEQRDDTNPGVGPGRMSIGRAALA